MNRADLEAPWNPDVLGELEMRHIPPAMGLGAIGGIRVIETPVLKYDEMVIMQSQQAICVGEVAHFRYRIDQLNRNAKLRAWARQEIEDMAWRVLGEHWKVQEK